MATHSKITKRTVDGMACMDEQRDEIEAMSAIYDASVFLPTDFQGQCTRICVPIHDELERSVSRLKACTMDPMIHNVIGVTLMAAQPLLMPFNRTGGQVTITMTLPSEKVSIFACTAQGKRASYSVSQLPPLTLNFSFPANYPKQVSDKIAAARLFFTFVSLGAPWN